MLTPSKAKAISQEINREARRRGWRPCFATGGDHRFARDIDGAVRCRACGQPGRADVAERAPSTDNRPERKDNT